MRGNAFALAGVLALGGAAAAAEDPAGGARIVGDYLEARTADVYTGPCFANGEVNLDGEEAVMAWRVRRGAWGGVDLAGLTVVAAVKAKSTLGDPFAAPHEARAVLVVDERASAAQRDGLVRLARDLGGDLVSDVVGVRSAAIEAEFDRRAGYARVAAAGLVEAQTRPLGHGDHLCGNESVYYPPLSSLETADATPAYTLAHAFRGDEFRATWSAPGKRSAFVGEFAR